MTPRWAQDGLKTGSRRVQERSKSHAFFVLIFESFWGRLGVVSGAVLGAKIVPKSLRRLRVDRLDIDLVIDWSQDGSKTVPRGLRRGFLGRLGGLLGPLWRVLGNFRAVLRGSWAALGSSWALVDRSWRPKRLSTGRFGVRFVDSIHRRDFVMRFVDSIRSLDRSMLLHHVVDTSRLNNSARKNVRKD